MPDFIDITFDFRSDTPPGKDPDALSPTLRAHHKFLLSRPLPNGRVFDLTGGRPKAYLHHQSEVGEHFLSSDSVIPRFRKDPGLLRLDRNWLTTFPALIVNEVPPTVSAIPSLLDGKAIAAPKEKFSSRPPDLTAAELDAKCRKKAEEDYRKRLRDPVEHERLKHQEVLALKFMDKDVAAQIAEEFGESVAAQWADDRILIAVSSSVIIARPHH